MKGKKILGSFLSLLILIMLVFVHAVPAFAEEPGSEETAAAEVVKEAPAVAVAEEAPAAAPETGAGTKAGEGGEEAEQIAIEEIQLKVVPPICGDGYDKEGVRWMPNPDVSVVPADVPYQIKDAMWLVPTVENPTTTSDFTNPSAPAVFKGGDTVYIGVVVETVNPVPHYDPMDDSPKPEGTPPYYYFLQEPAIEVEGADIVVAVPDFLDMAFQQILVLKVTVEHVPGEIVIENEIQPKCLEDGSHDEVIYCEKCSEEISRKTVTDPATGHDWDAWKVTKEPTAAEKGEKQRICKNDPSHVETEEIPATGEETETEEETAKNDIPKTGDTEDLRLWSSICLTSLLVLLSALFLNRKELRKR